ncbi:hypothetical protein ACFWMR_18000 [Amycolatopsis thailandensis]|uniref:hypothetical protein n=1 Tax=Amycolatopsis thailandensis TaxID=589330 RepID=UPI00365D57C6
MAEFSATGRFMHCAASDHPANDSSDDAESGYPRLVMDAFQPVPDLPHTPRITVDRLVVARETWRPRADELAFAQSKTESGRSWRRPSVV